METKLFRYIDELTEYPLKPYLYVNSLENEFRGETVMSLITWIVSVLLVNTVASAVVVLGAYRMMESHVALGAFGGIGIAAGLIYVQATLGEQLFEITVSEMKLLVIAAAVGAAIGVTMTILTVKPEL